MFFEYNKKSLFSFSYLFISVAYSFTCTALVLPVKSVLPRSHLLWSQQEVYEFAVSDSELIQTLTGVNTTNDLRQALLDASQTQTEFCHAKSNREENSSLDFVQGETTKHPDGQEAAIEVIARNNTDANPRKDFSSLSPRVMAAALRKLAHLSVVEEKQSWRDRTSQSPSKVLIVKLLEEMGNKIVQAKCASHISFGVYELSDVLQALAILSRNENLHHMQPLANLVVEILLKHDVQDIYHLGPIRLVQCLQASAKLKLQNQTLRSVINQRLLKPDAVSKIPARFISHGLKALSQSELEDKEAALLARAFMRRLRKQKVRKDATIKDLCQALVATNTILKGGGMNGFKDEAAIFGFTTLRAILEKHRTDPSHRFAPSELANMLDSWAVLSNKNRQDTVILELLDICNEEETFQRCNIRELRKIIGSVERLEIKSQAGTMQMGGERLLELVKKHLSIEAPINPKWFCEILRCPVLLHRHDHQVMKPYLDASFLLFQEATFLNSCGVKEISNFMWFMSVAHWLDEKVLFTLGNRALDSTLVESCSPKLACRILGTFTSILTFDENKYLSDEMQQLTANIFHEYGGHLLTSRLSSAEVSSALIAYAKATYLRDMGIYDHLVSLQAAKCNQATVRQLAQSLWSCGKIIAWENSDYQTGQKLDDPPYLANSRIIATELSLRTSELSCVDVAQCAWALGRLGIADHDILAPLIEKAKELVPAMNSVELSNILGSISKLGLGDDIDFVRTIVDRLTYSDVKLSAKQASSVLFSLGRMRYRDEDIFDHLCWSMMEQIDDASAQAIANALWAYKAVRIKPPDELLDKWAKEKFGLIGLQDSDTL